ncbi:MAG: hypothetical protein AAF641_08700 [Pseudomonadota bacterium]
MSDLTLTKTRLIEGVWEGALYREKAIGEAPKIEVTWQLEQVEGVVVEAMEDKTGWTLRVPVPKAAITDGVQTFLINDADTSTTLGQFCIVAGEELSYDIRAEVSLLREELDMLKRAFRRHCLETM